MDANRWTTATLPDDAPLPKACPWLTEDLTFAIAGAIAAVGMFLGVMV